MTVLAPERSMWVNSQALVCLDVTARGVQGMDCADLATAPLSPRHAGALGDAGRAAVTRASIQAAVAPEQVADIDVPAIAQWIVDRYPRRTYPAVVVGSPHGSAAHLAVALGAPWLPTAFETAVQWPGGDPADPGAAAEYGAGVAQVLLDADPTTAIRQVHDPVSQGAIAGATVSLVVRWRALPRPYTAFLDAHLAPGAAILVVQDARGWPTARTGPRCRFQLGSRASGLHPSDFYEGSAALQRVLRGDGVSHSWHPPADHDSDNTEYGVEPSFMDHLRVWAEAGEHSVASIAYHSPDAFSEAVADLYRQWLRAGGKAADRLVVECGRLLDPWQVLRAGLVPYWCARALRGTASRLEWWLAGSEPFRTVDVLLEPPCLAAPHIASLAQWRSVASFGTSRGTVDTAATLAYPYGTLPTRRATAVMRQHPHDLPPPPALEIGTMWSRLNALGDSRR